jgi:cobalamin biosynthesis protein CobD/CbiB
MAADAVAVLVFVGIGRAVHSHGTSVAGLASTAWPFLSGLVAGWLVASGLRRDAASVLGGLLVLISTVALGMALRVISDQGTALAFVVVATCFFGATMIGWRLLGAAVRSRHISVRTGHVPSSRPRGEP